MKFLHHGKGFRKAKRLFLFNISRRELFFFLQIVFFLYSLNAAGFDYLSGTGRASEDDLTLFLLSGNNKLETVKAREFAVVYMQEASVEDINYDVAFSQMCLETGFLKFKGQVKVSQNNFCGLGALDGGASGASFSSMRLGIRAHIQHLKAYTGNKNLTYEIIDPRFRYVHGKKVIKTIGLSRRWASDPYYGVKIRSLLISLYHKSSLYN